MGRITETIRCMVRLTDSAILEVAIRCSSAFSRLTDALKVEIERQTIEQPKRASGRSFASVVTRKRPFIEPCPNCQPTANGSRGGGVALLRQSRSAPSTILTGSRTRPGDWGWNGRFGPLEDRRNNRRLVTVAGGCLLVFLSDLVAVTCRPSSRFGGRHLSSLEQTIVGWSRLLVAVSLSFSVFSRFGGRHLSSLQTWWPSPVVTSPFVTWRPSPVVTRHFPSNSRPLESYSS